MMKLWNLKILNISMKNIAHLVYNKQTNMNTKQISLLKGAKTTKLIWQECI